MHVDVELEKIVAIVFAPDGSVYDFTYNWESAQNYALCEGLRVQAVKDDGHMTVADIQALCDAERERYNDCFGGTHQAPCPNCDGPEGYPSSHAVGCPLRD